MNSSKTLAAFTQLSALQSPRWFVVASRTEAVLYADGRDGRFHFRERLLNLKGSLTEGELVSDRPGRSASSAGGGSIRHGLGDHSRQHTRVAETFARRIADHLQAGRAGHQFSGLVLVAEPRFLGLLKKALDPQTRTLVQHEIGREYQRYPDGILRREIFKQLRAAS